MPKKEDTPPRADSQVYRLARLRSAAFSVQPASTPESRPRTPNQKNESQNIRKPATRVFQHFSFRRPDHAEPIRRSVGTRPKVKRAELEKCDSRLFAIIRGGLSHLSPPSHLLPESHSRPTNPSTPVPLLVHFADFSGFRVGGGGGNYIYPAQPNLSFSCFRLFFVNFV